MEVRDYNKQDLNYIIKLGKILHKNYEFKLDQFSKCKVLIKDNILIGFITYSIIYDRAEILDIIVDKEYRNKGYGKELLKSAIDDIIKSNCINITLEVDEKNISAINLYKKFNFEIASKRKNYYYGNDAFLMIRKW